MKNCKKSSEFISFLNEMIRKISFPMYTMPRLLTHIYKIIKKDISSSIPCQYKSHLSRSKFHLIDVYQALLVFYHRKILQPTNNKIIGFYHIPEIRKYHLNTIARLLHTKAAWSYSDDLLANLLFSLKDKRNHILVVTSTFLLFQ